MACFFICLIWKHRARSLIQYKAWFHFHFFQKFEIRKSHHVQAVLPPHSISSDILWSNVANTPRRTQHFNLDEMSVAHKETLLSCLRLYIVVETHVCLWAKAKLCKGEAGGSCTEGNSVVQFHTNYQILCYAKCNNASLVNRQMAIVVYLDHPAAVNIHKHTRKNVSVH